jgi:hypothetical protein
LGSRRSQPTIHLPRRPNFSQLAAHLRCRPISPPTFLYKSGRPSHNPNPPPFLPPHPLLPPRLLWRPATSPPPAAGHLPSSGGRPPPLLLLCPRHLPSSSASLPSPLRSPLTGGEEQWRGEVRRRRI